MFRKSVFIMLFVCLMSTVCSAVNIPAEWWIYQLAWEPSAGDANWNNPANWALQGSGSIPDGPDANNRSCVLPNQPGPRIEGNAKSYLLQTNAWDPTTWGGQDCNITVTATALDVNMGSYIGLNSSFDYDSYLGTTTLVNKAILNVYGGTVTTPGPYIDQTAMCGIHIGGGASNFAMAYGILNIYGGLVSVPKIELHYGEIGLYGGTLQVTNEPNFTISTTHPEATLNKVKINGGTLLLAGDQTAALAAPISSGNIVCERGSLGTPTFADGWTTLVSEVNLCVWSPTPANGATNVHYYNPDGNSITLSWRPSTFDDIDVNHDVYFGTSFADVNNALKADANYCYMGSLRDPCDPCSYVVKDPNKFVRDTTYYWRVDEYSNSGSTFKKGLVWNFKTHDGKAYNPKPVNGATALSHPLQLSWTSGDFTDIHRVFFGTSSTTVTNAGTSSSDGRYRGTVTSPVYPLTRLLETAAPAYVAWTMQAGTTYYWRIDEVNNFLATPFKGTVWSFTPATYVNIDDFEDSMSTEDVNANWPDLYPVTGCAAQIAHSGRVLYRDSTGKFLQYTFNNSGKNPAFTLPYTEAKRPYPGGASFTGGGVVFPVGKLLRVDYRGDALNPVPGEGANPLNDNMYVAIEDTAGNVSVYLNPDVNAQLVTNWTSWYTKLTDINAVGNTNLNAITGFAIGFGIRCNNYDYDGRGDTDPNGVVFFDNIRLYGSTCVPQYGPTTDLDGDCDVDINDLDTFVNDWLYAAVPQHNLTTYTVPHKAPVIWYKFNESEGTTVADYGSGSYPADVCQTGAVVWEPTGGRNGQGCINLNTLPSQNTHVEVRNPTTAFGFMADAEHYYNTGNGGSVSFSMWINANLTVGDSMTSYWATVFTVMDPDWSIGGTSWLSLPARWDDPRASFQQLPVSGPGNANAYGPKMQWGNFGGKWNHWAAVKSEPNTLIVYCNGSEIVRNTSADVEAAPLFKLPIASFRIAMRGGGGMGAWSNWGKWSGKMQDFQVYDYALSADEVAYLATDGTGVVELTPLISRVNFNKDGSTSPETDANQIVNFGDMAIMGQQWHTTQLWP